VIKQTASTGLEYPLRQIYFYLTSGCNLRCRHCWIQPKYQTEKGRSPELSVDLFKSIIEQALPLGLKKVKLTGGEPLLHGSITDLIEIVNDYKIGLTIETNGVLCTPELAKAIARGKKPFVSVSLDGADAATNDQIRGIDGAFKQALDGIRNLVAAGVKPQIIMTVMRWNSRQVKAMIGLAEKEGANSVKFNTVQPTARGEKMHRAGETLSIEELVELGHRIETELIPSSKLKMVPWHPPAFRPLGRLFGKEPYGGVCGIRGILGVLAEGFYALCGIGETVPEMIFGHSAVNSLKDVWLNNEVLNELRNGLPDRLEGICSQCLMSSRCLGNCIAQNYYTHHNLWAPYWYCSQALETGLFPETRLKPQKLSATVE
jgi:SynChlorMet cassette radical SAM/SPASM protein ScmF